MALTPDSGWGGVRRNETNVPKCKMLGNVRIIAFRELGGAGGLPGGSGLAVDSKKSAGSIFIERAEGSTDFG